MAKCPNCYSDRISLDGERGDGKCDECYGTGKEQNLGGVLSDFTGIRGNDCYKCHGTGQCQSCRGTGEA
jgi:hypothetical protein